MEESLDSTRHDITTASHANCILEMMSKPKNQFHRTIQMKYSISLIILHFISCENVCVCECALFALEHHFFCCSVFNDIETLVNEFLVGVVCGISPPSCWMQPTIRNIGKERVFICQPLQSFRRLKLTPSHCSFVRLFCLIWIFGEFRNHIECVGKKIYISLTSSLSYIPQFEWALELSEHWVEIMAKDKLPWWRKHQTVLCQCKLTSQDFIDMTFLHFFSFWYGSNDTC